MERRFSTSDQLQVQYMCRTTNINNAHFLLVTCLKELCRDHWLVWPHHACVYVHVCVAYVYMATDLIASSRQCNTLQHKTQIPRQSSCHVHIQCTCSARIALYTCANGTLCEFYMKQSYSWSCDPLYPHTCIRTFMPRYYSTCAHVSMIHEFLLQLHPLSWM